MFQFQFDFVPSSSRNASSDADNALIDLDTPFRDLAIIQVVFSLLYFLPIISKWEMPGELNSDMCNECKCI